MFDRTDADWLPDRAALDDLWRKRIKNDILSLRLVQLLALSTDPAVRNPAPPTTKARDMNLSPCFLGMRKNRGPTRRPTE